MVVIGMRVCMCVCVSHVFIVIAGLMLSNVASSGTSHANLLSVGPAELRKLIVVAFMCMRTVWCFWVPAECKHICGQRNRNQMGVDSILRVTHNLITKTSGLLVGTCIV